MTYSRHAAGEAKIGLLYSIRDAAGWGPRARDSSQGLMSPLSPWGMGLESQVLVQTRDSRFKSLSNQGLESQVPVQTRDSSKDS